MGKYIARRHPNSPCVTFRAKIWNYRAQCWKKSKIWSNKMAVSNHPGPIKHKKISNQVQITPRLKKRRRKKKNIIDQVLKLVWNSIWISSLSELAKKDCKSSPNSTLSNSFFLFIIFFYFKIARLREWCLLWLLSWDWGWRRQRAGVLWALWVLCPPEMLW